MTVWVTIRQVLSLVNLTFSLSLGVLYVFGYRGDDWQVAVCEWTAVWAAEFYVLTFFWDLGDEYFVEQVKEFFGWQVRDKGRYNLLYDDELALEMD